MPALVLGNGKVQICFQTADFLSQMNNVELANMPLVFRLHKEDSCL